MSEAGYWYDARIAKAEAEADALRAQVQALTAQQVQALTAQRDEALDLLAETRHADTYSEAEPEGWEARADDLLRRCGRDGLTRYG